MASKFGSINESSTSVNVHKSEGSDLKSLIDTAEPLDCFNAAPGKQALNLSWCFGYNPSLPVHNISNGNRRAIFYVAAHSGVLFDLENNRQCQLTCHSNPILCTAVSKDRRWLAMGDVGKDCCVSIWDSFSGVPVRTIFQDVGKGTVALCFSYDAKYLAIISMGIPQKVSIFDWTSEQQLPCCSVQLDPHTNKQEHISFGESDSSQLISNGEEQVVFYMWKDDKIEYHLPQLSDRDFNRTLGFLSGSTFIPGSDLALTTTSEGLGVVWEIEQRPNKEGKEARHAPEPHIRKPMKLMKLHTSPITAVTVADSYVVVGDSAGDIKFFDSELKMINWYDSFKYGPIVSLSFTFLPKAHRLDGRRATLAPKSAQSTIEAKPFTVPDFIIATTTASVAYVNVKTISSHLVLNEHDAAVNALAAHPKEPRLLIGSYSCKLKLWDYKHKAVLAIRQFEEPNFIQCVTFDPEGMFIGVGCTNGVVCVLDAISLQDVCEPFEFAKDCITHIVFSHDSRYLATADLDLCVTAFECLLKEGEDKEETKEMTWSYLGKHRAHYKPITGLQFGISTNSGSPRLLSLGQDRVLVEYDLFNSAVDDLRLVGMDRIEQSAVPLAFTWYPALSKEPFIITANDQYKLKLYNATTKMCRKTLLGPLYGTPITRMNILSSPVIKSENGEEVRRFISFTTKDKVGLLLLPHDGNPHNCVAFTAHPGQITEMSSSFDGEFVFTAGGEDCIVNLWKVNSDVLEISSKLGGEGLLPFYAMLEGGRDGPFFAELEDYFYYAQIKSQGPKTMETREVSTKVLLDQVPSIMRAIGFYPTEQEIEDLLNEVKFSEYVDTGKYVSSLELGVFIRLYINHRPAFGLSPKQLVNAFKTLGSRQETLDWSILQTDLLSLLQQNGEGISSEELVDHLMTLLGFVDDPEAQFVYNEDPIKAIKENISQNITVGKFTEEILGFQL